MKINKKRIIKAKENKIINQNRKYLIQNAKISNEKV